MPHSPLAARPVAAPWRVLLPGALMVTALHWWLLDGLVVAAPDRAPGAPGVAAPALAGVARPPPGEAASLRVRAVELQPPAGAASADPLGAASVGGQTARSLSAVVAAPRLLSADRVPSGDPAVGQVPVEVARSAGRTSTPDSAPTPGPGAPSAALAADPTRQPVELRRSPTRLADPDTARPSDIGSPGKASEPGPAPPLAGADESSGTNAARLVLAGPRSSGRGARPSEVSPGVVPAVVPAPSPTSPPPSAELIYGVRRGPLSGEGKLVWRAVAGSYTLSLEARLPVIGTIFSEHSSGGFDAWGLAPQRYTERRLRRSERALTMTRDSAGVGTLSFSASTATLPLPPGTQDRVSWLVQLAALFAGAAPGGGPSGVLAGGAILPVASVNGDLRPWQFKPGAPDGAWLHLERRSPDPYDTVAEVWLDPSRRYWPARIRLSEAGGDPLELVLRQWRE